MLENDTHRHHRRTLGIAQHQFRRSHDELGLTRDHLLHRIHAGTRREDGHFKTGVTASTGNYFGATIMAIQSGFTDQYANLASLFLNDWKKDK